MLEDFRVRLVTEDDLPSLLAWRNHRDVRRFMFTQHKIEPTEHYNWFIKCRADSSKRLVMVEKENHTIGFVQFSNISRNGTAAWGFYLRPNSVKGTGLMLGITALNYAFCQLELLKVCGQAIANNRASIAFHQRLGFVLEEIVRGQRYIKGRYHDIYCFGLTVNQWQPQNINVSLE